MSLLSRTVPVNLQEEMGKFMENPKLNPQFLYHEPLTEKKLQKYGLPQPKVLEIAQEIVDRAYWHRNEEDLIMLRGKLLSQPEVVDKINTFLDMHGLEDRFNLAWSSSFVTRTSITTDTIKLKLPSSFRHQDLLGMLYHEIGTHALRRINYEQQPWFQKKKDLKFANYLKTEEGLASLHSLLPRDFKLAYNIALKYLTVEYALTHSFVEVWDWLERYTQHPQRRWLKTFRVKRGLEDTAHPGAFTKDLVYFEGMISVWQWLNKHSFDITPLYFGKIALEDLKRAVELNPDFEPLLPSFYFLSPQQYAEQQQEIGETNFLNSITI